MFDPESQKSRHAKKLVTLCISEKADFHFSERRKCSKQGFELDDLNSIMSVEGRLSGLFTVIYKIFSPILFVFANAAGAVLAMPFYTKEAYRIFMAQHADA